MKKNKNVLFFVLIFIILISISYILMNKNIQNTTNDKEEINNPSEINWNIYTNSELGIKELRYPKNISISESKDPQGNKYLLLSMLPTDDPRQSSSIGIMSSMVISIDKTKTVEDIIENYQSDNYSENSVKIKEDNIGNQKAYKISYIGGYGGETNFIYLLKSSEVAGVIMISYTDTYTEIFDNIVGSIILN